MDVNTSSMSPIPVQCLQSLISYFNTARLAPMEKLYSLHQSALEEDQNGIQILGVYCFVSEEF